jgi:hypothetical protein
MTPVLWSFKPHHLRKGEIATLIPPRRMTVMRGMDPEQKRLLMEMIKPKF